MVANNIITFIVEFISRFIDFHDFACGIIVLTALSSFIYFFILNTKMNNAIKSLTKNVENLLGTTDEKMVILNEMITTKAKNKIIRTLWKKYYDTLLKYGGQGSNIEISTYFNKITLVDIPTQRKIGEIFPGILIATGILGTFTGLIVGLNSMDLKDSASIQKSMLPLMGGLKIGFLTSVLGIGTSLVWNILDRILLHRIVKSVTEFQVAYEQTFPSESLGSYLIEMIKLQSAQTAAVEQMSSNVSEEQSRSSSSVIEEQFYSKLSSSIASAINKSISSLAQGISDLNENVKTLENSHSGLNQVIDGEYKIAAQQSANDQIQTSTQLDKILEEVKITASTQEDLKQNITELNSSMKEISQSLNESVRATISNSMFDVSLNFINSIEEATEKIQCGIKNAFDDEMKNVTLHIDDTVENLQKTVENTAKEFEELKGTMKSVDNKLGDKILYPTKTKRGDGEFY